MEFFKKTTLILTLIVLLAACLRLPALGQFPVGITIDEAGQAYSAYSILKTGKDEWGDFLPLNPRSFGDYKPPVFMYLLVPSIGIFGLNEFATRLPSAIAGILTVLITYFLMRDLFKSRAAGLLSSLFIAISPWHVYYSRLGWESNIGLMFFTLGIWLFVKGANKGRFLALGVLSFGLAGLSYHSFKLLVPLMAAALIFIFWKQIRRINGKSILACSVMILIFVLIMGYGFIFSGAGRRAQDQSILKEENLTILRQMQVNDGLPAPLNRIVYNKYQFLISKVTDNYLGYFSLSFLFGPHRSNGSVLNFPSMGLLYLWQLPLILLGIFYLLKNRSQGGAVLMAWTFLAPIPASLTQDYMHAGRAQSLFPVLTLISALGLIALFELIKSQKAFHAAKLIVSLIIITSLAWRIDNYIFHTFNLPLGGLKQGYKEAISYTEKNKDNYKSVIFTSFHSEPHAFLAFYLKIDPLEIQEAAKEWKKFESDGLRFLDMSEYKLGKYEFRNIDISRERNQKNSLVVASPEEISPLIKTKYQVTDSSGKVVFVVIDTNEIPD